MGNAYFCLFLPIKNPKHASILLFFAKKITTAILLSIEEKEKRKEKELIAVACEIFSQHKHLIYIDLCEQIQQFMDVKERTAKSYIRFMREKEIIIKDPSNQDYFMIGINL